MAGDQSGVGGWVGRASRPGYIGGQWPTQTSRGTMRLCTARGTSGPTLSGVPRWGVRRLDIDPALDGGRDRRLARGPVINMYKALPHRQYCEASWQELLSISLHRDSLIKKGLIFSPDHGLVDFAVPHFSPFMRRRYPLE